MSGADRRCVKDRVDALIIGWLSTLQLIQYVEVGGLLLSKTLALAIQASL